MNEFESIRDSIDKETAKKIKTLLKKYKIVQDNVVDSVSAVILQNMENDGVIYISEGMVAELKDGIKKHLNQFSKEETEFLNTILDAAYKDAATKTAAALGIGIDWKILRQEFIDMAVNTPIDGMRFSDRVWQNTNDLANRIYNDIVECIKTGKRPSQIAREIKDDFGSSAYQATRLVNTELARTVTDAQLEVYKNSGVVSKVMWSATLEDNTCDDCAGMDGKMFDLNNTPRLPLHPNCRCCYIPVVDGWTPKTRADNETKQNIDYITYSEWAKNK